MKKQMETSLCSGRWANGSPKGKQSALPRTYGTRVKLIRTVDVLQLIIFPPPFPFSVRENILF